jgi:hypothetical protein
VAYVAIVNDTRGGNPNRRDGVDRAWRSLDSIVGEHYNERIVTRANRGLGADRTQVFPTLKVAKACQSAVLGVDAGGGVLLPPGFRGLYL